MRKHTKVYLEHFYPGQMWDYIPCEICSKKAVDIHHIESRGMGGSKKADTPENLMALCRSCHLTYGDIKDKKDFLKERHYEFSKKASV